MKSRQGIGAIVLMASTMLAAVGLVGAGGWLISAAALMPPILTLQVAIVGVRFFGIARGVSRWADRVVSHDLALRGTTQRRVELWKAAAELGPRGIWRLRGSDVLDRLTADSDTLQDDVTRVKTPFLAAVVAACVLVFIQTFNLPLAGLALFLAFVVSGFVVPVLTHRKEMQIARSAVAVRNRMSSLMMASVTHADEIRILGQQPDLVQQVEDCDAERVTIESQASAWAAVANALNGVSSGLALFSSLAAAVAAYSVGQLDGPTIAVLTLLPWASAEIVATFSQAASARTRVVAAAERIDQLLLGARALPHQNASATMERPQTLRLRDVSVAWDDEPVVRHVSFELKPGERLALLGSSGSGKSTLAAATLRLIEHRGSITLDDVEISELSDFRHHVSALLQTTYVFGTTVRENLRIANPHATDTEVVAALTAAGLVDWFSHLEAGLDTVIGDGARGMSGGEIQRLGIARVLLTQSTFVILDEPTEHLDAPTAAAVWQTMKSALADRGVLLITHDQQLAADCHRQIRIENGTLRP